MKNISINSFVLALLLLGSFACGAILVLALNNKYNEGLRDGQLQGRLATQREMASAVTRLVTSGFVVQHDDGQPVRYVLQPVATEKANHVR